MGTSLDLERKTPIPRRKPAELRDCKGTATFHSESDRHAIDHGNVIGENWSPIGQTCTILLPISDRGTARGGAIEGIHSCETGFSSQRFCFLGGLARSETLRFWQSGMTAAGTGSLVAERCSTPATTNGAYGTMLGARRAWHVHFGELRPAHCITPRNLVHGPTASRYWWAMTLETWCR